jgi:hypothetical protein
MSLRSLVCCGWEAPTQTKFTIAKWFYCTLFTSTAIATWVLRDYAGEYLSDNISSFKYCRQVRWRDGGGGAARGVCVGGGGGQGRRRKSEGGDSAETEQQRWQSSIHGNP